MVPQCKPGAPNQDEKSGRSLEERLAVSGLLRGIVSVQPDACLRGFRDKCDPFKLST